MTFGHVVKRGNDAKRLRTYDLDSSRYKLQRMYEDLFFVLLTWLLEA